MYLSLTVKKILHDFQQFLDALMIRTDNSQKRSAF